MTEMIYQNLARELIAPLYCGERIRYEAGILSGGRTEKLVMIALTTNEAMYPSRLCKAVHASSPRMAVMLNDLEERGMIVRIHETADSRRTRIEATEKGRQFALECMDEMQSQMSATLELMGEEDAREYVRLQTKLSALISENSLRKVRFPK